MSKFHLGLVSLVVEDYDDAIAYYVGVLGFRLNEDTALGDEKRWVVVAPPESQGTRILLARASNVDQRRHVGNQTGGRVFLFLHTEDFEEQYGRMRAAGVRFIDAPRTEPYGKVVVFEDLYGNRWDLVQPVDLDDEPAGHDDRS